MLSENNVVGLAEVTPKGYRETGRFEIADQGLPSLVAPGRERRPFVYSQPRTPLTRRINDVKSQVVNAPALIALRPRRRVPSATAHRTSTRNSRPTFRVTRDTVPIFATVIDKDNRLVAGLTREDFQLFDNGKAQPLTLFDNSPQPVRLIVMLDVSGSMIGNLPLLRAACAQLFSRLGPDDRARVGTFGHEIEISPTFTRDTRELHGALPT